jgi:hypothetical protein
MHQLFSLSSNRQVGPGERLGPVGEFPDVFGSSVVVTCQSLLAIFEEVGKEGFVDVRGKVLRLEGMEIEVQNQVEC